MKLTKMEEPSQPTLLSNSSTNKLTFSGVQSKNDKSGNVMFSQPCTSFLEGDTNDETQEFSLVREGQDTLTQAIRVPF